MEFWEVGRGCARRLLVGAGRGGCREVGEGIVYRCREV